MDILELDERIKSLSNELETLKASRRVTFKQAVESIVNMCTDDVVAQAIMESLRVKYEITILVEETDYRQSIRAGYKVWTVVD